MSIPIVISGQVIDFPESSASPNWAPAIIAFAEAVETALNGLSGSFDVPPSTFDIDGAAFNPTGSAVDLPNLSFSTSAVRGAYIRLAVGRTTDDTSAYETTLIITVYNPDGDVGSKWEFSRTTIGDGMIDFSISDAGQVSFTTAALTGTASSHLGLITYSATAMQSNP